MVMYCFVPTFRETSFGGVPSRVFDKTRRVAGKKGN